MTAQVHTEYARKINEHRELFMRWRLDPTTQEMSFHTLSSSPEYFVKYFDKYFYIKDLRPFFLWVNGHAAAFVGFDPYVSAAKAAEISIVVAPEDRGQGVGKKALFAACSLATEQGYEELYAEIKPHNSASLRLFENAGFVFVSEVMRMVGEKQVLAKLFKKELRPLKQGRSIFIIAEAGSNWRMGSYERDLKMAKALIEVAAQAAVDAVKFQTYRPETIYVPNAGHSDYLRKSGIGEEMSAIFSDLAMPYEMLGELAAYCNKMGVEFMSTPFSPQDFAAVDPFVRRHKIASYEIHHLRLLELAAKSKKPLILSTGASDIDDIAWAISYFKICGGQELTLLQCTAQYPAATEAMNLQAIAWMQQAFDLPIGLSDHSQDPLIAPVAAAALGATVIEKHFTLSRHLPGPDHAFAVTPEELKKLVEAVRVVESMRGQAVKHIHKEEIELYTFAKRRIQAIADIQKGECFQEGVNIAILRPGAQKAGVSPILIDEIVGKQAVRSIAIGEGVQHGDWK